MRTWPLFKGFAAVKKRDEKIEIMSEYLTNKSSAQWSKVNQPNFNSHTHTHFW